MHPHALSAQANMNMRAVSQASLGPRPSPQHFGGYATVPNNQMRNPHAPPSVGYSPQMAPMHQTQPMMHPHHTQPMMQQQMRQSPMMGPTPGHTIQYGNNR
eukprot:UN03442